MSKNQAGKTSNPDKENIDSPILSGTVFNEAIEKKKPTSFKTVGTCRKSKSGNAISIKLFPENRFLHVSIRDIESIVADENNTTVANVREYEKLETLGGN